MSKQCAHISILIKFKQLVNGWHTVAKDTKDKGIRTIADENTTN